MCECAVSGKEKIGCKRTRLGRVTPYPSLVDDPFALTRSRDFATPALSGPPRLLVVVDTEETFDWNAPFDRLAIDTGAMAEIGRGQELCDAVGLAPTYVLDYPVACDARAMDELSGYAREGRATIGAHLHGWVCPPYEEEVNTVNSYQGNLPVSLEKQKLQMLRDRIEDATGTAPDVHKAGRYGFGWGTTKNLKELGFTIDLSPTPGFDLTGDGGPNHENLPNSPGWLDEERQLLAIPGTGGFVGLFRSFGAQARGVSESALGRRFRTGGVFSRLKLLERIRLSPEGSDLDEMKRLTHSLLNQGEKVFSLTYHSPSLEVGCTPYVRDKQDLKEFLRTIEEYLSFFVNELEGRPETPLSLREEIRVLEGGPAK